ncbi:MAG: isocitrate lyase/phosphoenolpyruvate mutase family protein [Pseudomonadota bacterium]
MAERTGGHGKALKALLDAGAVLAPGVCDALTAHIAARAGAQALYVSGAALSYTRLGRPDVGLTMLPDVAAQVAQIADRADLPMIVDADTGFGNAINVAHTVRTLERAGAAAIQLEDQTFPKRCGHLKEKSVIPLAEMRGKLAAALDARDDALIVARTDAAAVDGLDAAIERAAAFGEDGADVVFVEAPRTREDLSKVAGALTGVRLLANMVEGGATPVLSLKELSAIGFRLVIFPGGIVRATAHAAEAYYAALLSDGSTARMSERMLSFDALNALLGTPELLAEGKRYEDAS